MCLGGSTLAVRVAADIKPMPQEIDCSEMVRIEPSRVKGTSSDISGCG